MDPSMELEALRYADAREAAVRADRSGARAHVCVRADGLRLRPYRQCAAGDRVRRAVPAAAPSSMATAHVTYVRNITDVDDKINARAAERGIAIRDLTEETYSNFKEDVAALGCLPPDVEPRATEHIEEMKTLIERLVAAGHAYVAEEHVLFSVPSMPDYGKLVEAPARRDDRGRARRGRALQARPDGFRAVEAVEAGRAGLAVALPASRRRAGPAGTSNARRCRGSISARPSTSTAAASISCSRTTRTRSRSRAARSTRR